MKHPFWDWCAENFRQTLVVPGNHELYCGFDAGQLAKEFSHEVRENVRYYNNKVVTIDGVDIILSTLWANISVADAFMVERSINDFRRIVCDEERLTFTKFNQMHEESLEFIKQAIAASTASKKIVVTHHLPSNLLVAERFRGSRLNGAFVSEQGNWIAESNIDYWIYGHSHTNIDDVIGSTVCVSNQLGYVDYNGMPESDFDPGKIIYLI